MLCCFQKASAQFSITPSDADPCLCTGSIMYTPPSGAINYSYYLLDQHDDIIEQGTNINGGLTLSNLCPSVFHIVITQANGTIQDHYFNVAAGSSSTGNAHSINMCLEQYPNVGTTYDLTPEISTFSPGGTWYNPDGLILPDASLSTIAVWQQTNPSNLNETELTFDNGWYTYTTSVGGCDVTSGIYIQTNDVGLTTTYVICETYEPFDMTDFLQGTPDTIGQWFDSNNNIVPGGIFDPATMSEALFTYVISNLSGCSPVFRSMYVDEQTQRSAGEDGEVLVCSGSSNFNMLQYLEGNPDDDAPNVNNDGYWTLPSGANLMPLGNDMFSPSSMQAGVYTYITNSAAPCLTQSATLTISFTNYNPSGLSAPAQMCSIDGPLNMLTALGGVPLAGGTWTNSSGATVDGTFNPLTEPAGNYSYYYPNVGCNPGSSILSISVEAPKNAGSDNTETICQSDPNFNLNTILSANASNGGTWAMGANTISNIYDPVNSGVFNFTYTVDGNACPDDVAYFTVYVQPSVADPISQSIYLCSLQDPVDMASYFPALANVYFEDLSGTLLNYTFDPELQPSTVINVINPSGNACPDQEGQLTINVVYPLIENGSSSVDLCRNSDIFDLNSTIPALAVGQGTWSDINGNPVSNLIPVNFTGTQTFAYDVIQAIQCGGEHRDVSLVAFEPNDAGSDASDIFCYTDGPQLLSALLPISAQVSGEWYYNGMAYNSGLFDPGNNSSGNYIFRIPANGPCPADEATLALTVQQGINYTAGSDIHVCAGSPFQILGSSPVPGTTFEWSPASGLSNPNSAQPSVDIPAQVLQSSTVTYSVFADDGICTFTDYVDVTTEPNPIVDLQSGYDICFGEFLTLPNPANIQYQWTPFNLFDDPNSASPTIQPTASVYIGVTATNSFGCVTQAQSQIEVNPLPLLMLNPIPTSGCPPLEIQLIPDTASSNVDQIVWTIAGVGTYISDTLNASLNLPGNFDVQATAISEHNCISSYFYEEVAEVFPRPVAHFSITPMEISTLEPEAEFTNHSVGAINYHWEFDQYGSSEEQNPSFAFPNERSDNFRNCLIVGNEFGCFDTTCRSVYMNAEYAVFASNAFTPDNDGDNDVWKPTIRGFSTEGYELVICNRWGDVVFGTNDPDAVWTGEYRNGEYFGNNEVYNWQLKLRKKFTTEDMIFRGNLILIR